VCVCVCIHIYIYTIQDSDEIDNTAIQLTNKALAAASHDERVTVFLFCVLGGGTSQTEA
jgi:hypothetical protein